MNFIEAIVDQRIQALMARRVGAARDQAFQLIAQHRHLKCPVCNFEHRDVASRHGNFTPQTQHICSHGGRVIFMKQDCPICWEETEPLVAFPCGHGVCKPCFQQLGGRTGEDVERAARGRAASRAAVSGNARRNAFLDSSDSDDGVGNAQNSNSGNNPRRVRRSYFGVFDSDDTGEESSSSASISSREDLPSDLRGTQRRNQNQGSFIGNVMGDSPVVLRRRAPRTGYFAALEQARNRTSNPRNNAPSAAERPAVAPNAATDPGPRQYLTRARRRALNHANEHNDYVSLASEASDSLQPVGRHRVMNNVNEESDHRSSFLTRIREVQRQLLERQVFQNQGQHQRVRNQNQQQRNSNRLQQASSSESESSDDEEGIVVNVARRRRTGARNRQIARRSLPEVLPEVASHPSARGPRARRSGPSNNDRREERLASLARRRALRQDAPRRSIRLNGNRAPNQSGSDNSR